MAKRQTSTARVLSANTPLGWPVVALGLLLTLAPGAADCGCRDRVSAPMPAFGPMPFAAARRGAVSPTMNLRDDDLRALILRLAGHDPPAMTLSAAEAAYLLAGRREWSAAADCVDYYYWTVALSWHCLHRAGLPAATDDQATRACDLYHSALARLIVTGQQFGRLDPTSGLTVHTPSGPVRIGIRYCGFPWKREDFHRLVLVGGYREPRLTRLYRQCGMGVPLLAIRRQPDRTDAGKDFLSKRSLFAATLLLRPDRAELLGHATPAVVSPDGQTACRRAAAKLELYDPLRVAQVEVAGCPVPLAGDISAPLAFALRNSQWQPLQAYLRPDDTTPAELIMVEPYQRGKIPLVFVHGLLSDPLTYLDMVNDIRADRHLNARYQIWAFEYPTGRPFLESAATLRAQLHELILRCAAEGADPALSRTVMVGHSMGGLLTKLEVTDSGTGLWDRVANQPFENVVMDARARHRLAQAFFFERLEFVTRVVLVATPHDGSPWATRLIGRVGTSLVSFSQREDERHRQIVQQNPGVFAPEVTDRLPTSVDMLKRGNPILAAARQLPIHPHVRAHSIIGTGHTILHAGPADGVVPVSSARHPGVDSEAYVAARHTTILRHSAAIHELQRILRAHLATPATAVALQPAVEDHGL